MLGDTYTTIDMAVWGWATRVPLVLGAEAYVAMPHVKRLVDEISGHPQPRRYAPSTPGRA